MNALVCCGNYYLCKVKLRCNDEPECHAIAKAIVGSETDRYRRCHVVVDKGFFRYEFEMLPTVDFRKAIRKLWRKRARK